MKKMKRLLVAILSGLTAIACIAGVSACKNSADKNSSEDKAPVDSSVPNTDININFGGNEDPTLGCVHDFSVVYQDKAATCDADGVKVIGCSKCGKQLDKEIIPALGHTYTYVEEKPATCTEAGYEEHITCVTCNQVFRPDYNGGLVKVVAPIEIKATGHTKEDFANVCEKGVKCSVCEEVLESEVKHTMVSAFGTKVEDATLTVHAGFNTLAVNKTAEDGIYYVDDSCVANTVGYEAFKYCSVCYSAWDATKAKDLAWSLLTKTADKMEYLFGAEGKVYSEGYEVIPVEHNMVDAFEVDDEGNVLGIAPDCVTKGITANFKYCKDCSAMPTQAAQGKTLFATVDEWATATVEVDGVKVPVNVVEGYTTVDALGHTWEYEEDGVVKTTYKAGKEATCTTPGATWSATCKRTGCSHKVDSKPIAKYDHKIDGEYAIAVEPTCDKNAICALCEVEIPGSDAKIKATGHKLVEVPDNATNLACGESGWKDMEYCSVCDYVKVTSVQAKPHAWKFYAANYATDTLKTKLAAVTCEFDTGVYNDHYKCTTCNAYGILYGTNIDEVEVSEIWATGGAPKSHTQRDDYEEATCVSASKNFDCAVCGENVADWDVKALGHDYRNEPTCTKDGTCDRCGVVAGSALAHKVDNKVAWVYVTGVAATCEEAGYVGHYECSLCNVKAYKEGNSTYKTEKAINNGGTATVVVNAGIDEGELFYLAPLGHDYVEVAKVLPTCVKVGHEAYEKCTNCGDTVGYDELTTTCASDIKSCADLVPCNCSYLEVTIASKAYVVEAEGYYVLDAETKLPKLVDENTNNAVKAVWKGCGELTENTNKIDCVGHDTNGLCLVCGKEVAHDYQKDADKDGKKECICGKEEE